MTLQTSAVRPGLGARNVAARAAIYAILIAFAAYFLMPIYVLVITALKPYAGVDVATMWQLPAVPSFDAFLRAWEQIGGNFTNSMLIVIPAALVSTMIGAVNGYVFAKWRFRGSEVIFRLVLFGMFLPYQGLIIPLVLTLRTLGLYGSIPGLIVVHAILGIPITALMFRTFFAGIPDELLDAAKIDGCGFFRIFRWLMLPVAPPVIAVVLLWQFTTIWNDFILAVVVLNSPTVAPVTVAVQNLAGSYSVEWNVQMAGALIAALPTIVVYLLLGKLFMRGLLAGAVKG
ncbi:carbohydrate ABC transporter permease [Pseudonocardia nigra]|uniref:carbohydrate ABC transporter permease n=1 Tax=Pseudonocardia nigra TaxID=1921578 RepID=UPI001C5DCFAC|nr:carbohydrate ABC transporter permease [Pseudonocardia nigra]